jgi:asparagine synthase (glutamine-hydrolysing)
MKIEQYEEEFYDEFNKSIKLMEGNKPCIAFSGGVDSSLLACLCKNYLGCDNLSLISVRFDGDEEIDYIKWAADILETNLISSEITYQELEKGIIETLGIIEYDRVALLENAIGYYFIFKLATSNGFDTILSGNGLDELFCGYDVFRRRYSSGETRHLINHLTEVAKKDKIMIDKISRRFDINYLCPFLEENFIKLSKKIPLSLKIKDENDDLRKHFIRKMASQMGLPNEIFYRKKKSFQYSSGLHRSIRKLARINGYTNKKGKELGYESGMKAYVFSIDKSKK